jgi:hypothetical protein
MARSRIVRPEFWSDEKMATISRDARLTYIGMWNLSDDYGVVKGNPMWLKNNIYPYEDISQEVFRGWLNELMRLKRIVPFEVNSEGFYLIRNFLKHQTINRPSQTRNPTPPDTLTTDSLNAHDILIDETEYKQSINRVKTETETEERARGKKQSPPSKSSSHRLKMRWSNILNLTAIQPMQQSRLFNTTTPASGKTARGIRFDPGNRR